MTDVLQEITFTSEMDVQLVSVSGGDETICQAARVSTKGAGALDTAEAAGLINFLVKNRHASPLEHVAFSFMLSVPTVVVWQLVRHRFGSFNIKSGRYSEMIPKFYLPAPGRPLVQVGKPGEYRFEPGTSEQYAAITAHLISDAEHWWADYQRLRHLGIAREVARLATPFHLFWDVYWTVPVRSLMNVLALRTATKDNAVPSFPQAEIEQLANKVEAIFAERMPLTHAAWTESGRPSPWAM